MYHSTSGNNIYGADVRETLLRLQKEGTDGSAAYILMQRIFPTVFQTFLLRNGICHKDNAVSELGIYGAYLRYIGLAVIQWKTPNLPCVAYRDLFRCNIYFFSEITILCIHSAKWFSYPQFFFFLFTLS